MRVILERRRQRRKSRRPLVIGLLYPYQQRLSAGDQILRHAAARLHAAGREATTDLRCGAAADEVIAAARGAGADLIVVGAANKSALGRIFLGSVSARVLSHAPCSVLIAR